MDKLTEYKVMLINPKEPKTAELLNKLYKGSDGTNGLEVAINAYKTELSLMTEMPEDMFAIRGTAICVAFTDDYRVLGFVSVGIDQMTSSICIEHVYVRPEVRQKGIYKLMLKRIEKMAKDAKCDRIMAFVFDVNGASKMAHRYLGFKRKMIGFMKEVQ